MRNPSLVVALALAFPTVAAAQHEGVSSTVHNLSASGPGEIRALQETEVCKFCHIPHNAVVPQPLWGHTLSAVDRYEVPTVRRGKGMSEPAPQPDGSSRLCLSCHDGTVALGDIGGSGSRIAMAGAQRLDSARRGHIGTDLSGSHPISFVVPDGDPGGPDSERDMGLRPLALIHSEESISLDAKGKMQCTTCHDPHSDRHHDPGRVPRFWVKPTVDEVCLACHELR
jgi:hypothetical protein